MTTAKGGKNPETVVYDFVNFLKERNFSEAYWLLTGPERAVTPLHEWISEDWNSPDDEMGVRITEITTRLMDHVSEKEVIVEAALEFSDDSEKIKTSYVTRLEMGDWYVYLGLDHSKGSWTFRRLQDIFSDDDSVSDN